MIMPNMKTLYLVRHAHAQDALPRQPDRDRSLSPRGERDAALMGQRLAVRGARPHVLLVSPAARTLATAGLLAHALGLPAARIAADERLYGASAEQMLAVVGEQAATVATLMLVSHNPGITELAQFFDEQVTHLRPGAVVELAFRLDEWAGLGMAEAQHTHHDSP
jgi:phosphohistidine phosphatase